MNTVSLVHITQAFLWCNHFINVEWWEGKTREELWENKKNWSSWWSLRSVGVGALSLSHTHSTQMVGAYVACYHTASGCLGKKINTDYTAVRANKARQICFAFCLNTSLWSFSTVLCIPELLSATDGHCWSAYISANCRQKHAASLPAVHKDMKYKSR